VLREHGVRVDKINEDGTGWKTWTAMQRYLKQR
jgi:hypothetical protein